MGKPLASGLGILEGGLTSFAFQNFFQGKPGGGLLRERPETDPNLGRRGRWGGLRFLWASQESGPPEGLKHGLDRKKGLQNTEGGTVRLLTTYPYLKP